MKEKYLVRLQRMPYSTFWWVFVDTADGKPVGVGLCRFKWRHKAVVRRLIKKPQAERS